MNKEILLGKIRTLMDNFNAPEIQDSIISNRDALEAQYFTATNLYQELKNERV